jgi:hypothetical protein
MVMSEMQAVYDDELSGGSGGLMSLMRGVGDFTLGEEVMDNLPDILAMLRNTNKDTLTMRQTQEMGKPSEIAITLSETPGLESLLSDTEFDLGNLDPMFAGTTANPQDIIETLMMVGPGKKIGMADDSGKSLQELMDELMRAVGKQASDADMDATRKAAGKLEPKPDFLKSFEEIRQEQINKEMFENRPSRSMPRDPKLDQGLGSLDPTIQDAVDKAGNIRNPSYVIEELEDTVNSFGRGIKSRNIPTPALTREQGEKALARLSEQEQGTIRALRAQHSKAMKEIFGPDRDPMSFEKEQEILEKLSELDRKLAPYFIRSDLEMMSGGGRPGLYANIAAKRKRIEAGSGEKMRKPGSKGAPTKENFRQAETTAKKAAGGALNYSKGYYGKSYK